MSRLACLGVLILSSVLAGCQSDETPQLGDNPNAAAGRVAKPDTDPKLDARNAARGGMRATPGSPTDLRGR